MSNRIDFFQSSQSRPAIPAACVSITLDGMLCPELEPIEIIRSGWPEFSLARLAYNPAAYPDSGITRAEDFEVFFSMGRTVRISQYFNGTYGGAAVFGLPLFTGRIENIRTSLTETGESVEITARDFSANLERICVYGRRIKDSSDTSMFLAGLDTVFNPDGKGNADPEPITINGKSYTVFCAELSQARHWSYAEILDYLLSEYLTIGQLHTPSTEQLTALTDRQIARDLDVTGLNLADALQRCCERIGLSFKFIPRLASTGPTQAIEFYKPPTGRKVELSCQQAGEQFSISRTNIAAFHSSKNFRPVTHRYIGQGDFKTVEATFDLIKAWDGSLEDINYDKFSPSTNPDFYQVKDVYRKWCLNEAGDYSGQPYNRGDAFDFTGIFDSGKFARRRRRFWPALTGDKQGKSLGYFLEVSFDAGLSWWQYLYAFNILPDECGLWLSSDQLDVDTWSAALQGDLKFRLTASVVSDERLTCIVSDGPVNSAAAVVEHIITLPRQFKHCRISDKSIFANSSDEALGEPDEVDDTDALYEFIRHKAASSAIIETFDIRTPFLAFDYRVGDIVTTEPQSRDLLSVKCDNRSTSRITRVKMDFKKQCTRLKIVRQRSR
ncbi:MAG: hypothetical protein JW837_08670 [Sedimentisphaerales bacterium]|nr:hypothetical protein [Sedimentisphaerales bacterium]